MFINLRAVQWPRLPKMALFGTKNAYFSIVSHGIVWYCMELLCILWYRIVLHVIALYLMVLHGIVLYLTVLHGIALLGSARGLYLLYKNSFITTVIFREKQ